MTGACGRCCCALVDNFIVKLRRKIERAPDKPERILTVYGYGYSSRSAATRADGCRTAKIGQVVLLGLAPIVQSSVRWP